MNEKEDYKMEKSFKDYCLELFKESNVTGVSSIITSRSVYRKLMKLFILVFGIAGFLLQTRGFLQHFWEFSAVSSVERINRMKKPAITICDENLLSRRYLCENVTGACHALKEEDFLVYRALFPEYFLDPRHIYSKLPKTIILKYQEEYFNINFTKASGFDIEASLEQCEWISKDNKVTPCNEPQFVRGLTTARLPGACYTLKSDDEELEQDSELGLTLKWYTADTLAETMFEVQGKHTERAYWIAFHYSGHASNPFAEGFRIEEGRSYKVEVTQIDTVRLPPPYSTKCLDYASQWKKNHFRGPLGREDCKATCQINIRFEAFGCVPRDIEYPHDKKLCIGYKLIGQDLNLKIQNCMEECSDACTETEYIADVEIEGEISYETGIKDFDTPLVSMLRVVFDDSKSKTVLYRSKYESVELFSYIGGYLGMWLGWSLFAAFDFVEILLNLLLFPLIKRSGTAERLFVHQPNY